MRIHLTHATGFIGAAILRFALSRTKMTIEDDVGIGASSVILNGAILRRGGEAVANSIVNLELAPYFVNAGSSCRGIDFCE